MRYDTVKTQFNSLPVETQIRIVSDMQEISECNAIDSAVAADDELNVEELVFVTAARKVSYKDFLDKAKKS